MIVLSNFSFLGKQYEDSVKIAQLLKDVLTFNAVKYNITITDNEIIFNKGAKKRYFESVIKNIIKLKSTNEIKKTNRITQKQYQHIDYCLTDMLFKMGFIFNLKIDGIDFVLNGIKLKSIPQPKGFAKEVADVV